MEYLDMSEHINFFIRFAPNKISMNMGGEQNNHYSVSFGMGSRILDIHKTNENTPTSEKHEGHFYLRHFTLGRVIVYLQALAPQLLKVIKGCIVPAGILQRLDLVLVPIQEELALQLFKLDKKGTRMKPRKDVPISVLDKLISDWSIAKKGTGTKAFMAFKERRGGLEPHGLVISLPHTNRKVLLLTKKKIRKFGSTFMSDLMKIIEPEMVGQKQQQLAKEVHNYISMRSQQKILNNEQLDNDYQ